MNRLSAKIESLLFYMQDELSVKQIAQLCEVKELEVKKALKDLAAELEGRGVSLVLSEEAAQLATNSEFSEFLAKIREEEINTDLTEAQSEALATIAYLAPVQKVRIDFIRGVNSRAVLRNLSARGLISKTRRDNEMMYDLTTEALAHLGITSCKDLPDYEETREKLEAFSDNEASSETTES